MPNYKLTLYTAIPGPAAGEVWYTPNLTPGTEAVEFQTFINLRNAMIYPAASILGLRISVYGQKRQSWLAVAGAKSPPQFGAQLSLPPVGAYVAASSDLGMDQWRAALQMKIGVQNNQYASHYINGIPKTLISNQFGTISQGGANANWWAAMNTFMQHLVTAGYQVPVYSGQAPVAIRGIIQQSAAPGLIGLVVNVAPSFDVSPGAKIRVQGLVRAKGTRNPTMNGTWTVNSYTAPAGSVSGAVYLNFSAAISPNQNSWTPNSQISGTTKTLVPILSYYPYRGLTHKRGKAPTVPRGRRLTRLTLDP